MRRRTFLAAGAATVITVGAGTAYIKRMERANQPDGPEYEPWKDWRDAAGGGPPALVRAALLAASPHNTQPWRFHVGESFVELHIDRQRNVGALDPYLREEFIGMGCALENLLLAAPANGYAGTAHLAPGPLSPLSNSPRTELAARVEITPAPREEPELYRAIPLRHTNRSSYDGSRALSKEFIDELVRVAGGDEEVRLCLFTSCEERKRIVNLSAEANAIIYSDPRVEAASQRWIRLSEEETRKFRDGLTVDGFGLPPMTAAVAKALPSPVLRALVSKGQMNGYSERMLAAPLIGMIAARDRYDRAQCLSAGRVWQRAHLLATARGVAGRPGNEAMEMIDFERATGGPARFLARIAELTGFAGWEPTFVFLMGYPTLTAHASPRRPMGEVLDA